MPLNVAALAGAVKGLYIGGMKPKKYLRPPMHPLPQSFLDKQRHAARVEKKAGTFTTAELDAMANESINKTQSRIRQAKRDARHAGDVPFQKPPKGKFAPDPNKRKSFYASWEWRRLRMEALKRHGHRCQSCGATTEDITIYGAKIRLVVDHILPLGKHWELRLDPENVQVLCDECNMGKGDWDTTDFRPRHE